MARKQNHRRQKGSWTKATNGKNKKQLWGTGLPLREFRWKGKQLPTKITPASMPPQKQDAQERGTSNHSYKAARKARRPLSDSRCRKLPEELAATTQQRTSKILRTFHQEDLNMSGALPICLGFVLSHARTTGLLKNPLNLPCFMVGSDCKTCVLRVLLLGLQNV